MYPFRMKHLFVLSFMLMSLLPSTILNAADTFTATTTEGVEMNFKVISESAKTAIVSSGQEDVPAIPVSTTGTVTIPQEVKGYRITGIGDEAFRETSLSAVSIPVGVSYIGGKAFAECSNLSSVTLPEGMTFIGEEAFSESALSTIVLPASLVRIGEQAFEGTRLTTITLPQNVAYLGNADRVDEETGELVVEDDLFADIFNGCSALAEVNVDAANKNYASINGILMTKDLKTLLYFPQAKTDNTIPSGVETIYCDAFADCSFSSITLPASITAIEEDAFDGCYQLSSIISEIMNPRAINHDAFSYSVYDQATLYVPVGTKALYEATDGWNLFQNIVEMDEEPSSVPYIVWCKDNSTLYFLSSNTELKKGGTYDGQTITDVWSGEDVTNTEQNETIGQFSPPRFKWTTGECTRVVFDKSFETVRVKSTSDWFNPKLESIEGLEYLNTSEVTSMSYMFAGLKLSNLDLSHLDTHKVKYMHSMFEQCSGLTDLDLSHFDTGNVQSMAFMFSNCPNLRSIDFSSFDTKNVENMSGMFRESTSLATLDLSSFNTSNVTTMRQMCYGCSNLTSIDMSSFDTGKVTDMWLMFSQCVALKDIYAGDGWSTVNVTNGSGMFGGCTSLVGGQGTAFDANHIDYTYAHIDGGTDNPGYLRDRNQQEQDEEQEKAIEEAKNELHAMIDAWREELEYVYRMLTDKATREEADVLYARLDLMKARLEDAEYRLVKISTLEEVEMLRKEVDDIRYELQYLAVEVDRFGRIFTVKTVEGIEMTFKVIMWDEKTCQVGTGISNEPAIEKFTSGQVTIPSTANGYKVISIGNLAFSGCTELTSVIIPDGVESISSQAFYFCGQLADVSIPNSVTSIGSGAFQDCAKLTSITIPNSVTSIGEMAFSGSGLTSITIPHSVTKIEGYTFQACRGLTTVTIPSTIAEIDGSAFRLCTGLTSIEVEEGNTRFASQDDVLFTKDMTTLVCYPAGRADPSYTIPNSVTQIGTQSFAYCLNLTSMDFPSSLQSIGWSAFTGCSSLASVTFPNSLTWINMYAFQDCSSLSSITIPGSVNHLSEMAFNGCTGLKEITFEKCLGIDALLIGNCTGVERVVIYDDNPVAVSDKAFWLDWDGPMTTATLYVPFGTKALYEATDGWSQFQNIVEMEPVDIEPLENGDVIDFGDFVDESGVEVLPALDGNVVGNLYFNILNDNGGYDAEEGCIVITESTADETIERIADKDFYDKELRETFTGIIFKVPAGSGNIKITAEALGSMLLKVRIGDDEPQSFELDGRQKVKIPYTVSEETLVYIYAGEDAAVKSVHPVTASSGMLRIFGIESESIPTTIADVETSVTPVAIYSVSGQRLAKPQKGINIIGGKKVVVK